MGRSFIPARAPHTVTRQVGDEFVVLDEASGRVVSLDGPAAAVWEAAGTTAEVDLAALDELTSLGLLDAPGPTRRTWLKRTGAVAVGIGITTIRLPAAAAANSKNPHAALNVTSGPKGTVVPFTGGDFTPNTLIQVTVNGVSAVVTDSLGATGVTTDSTGAVPAGTRFIVPDTGAATGPQPVAIIVIGTPSTSAGNFTISTPAVTLSATTFAKNGSPKTFTVTASSGFLPGALISATVTAPFTAASITAGPTTVNGGGAIPTTTVFTLTYPNGTSGTGSVTIKDAAGNAVTVSINIP